MTNLSKDDFKLLLKKADLTKKDFAELLGTSYQGVNNWGTNGRDYPYWVKSWLELYIKDKKCQQLKSIIKESDLLD